MKRNYFYVSLVLFVMMTLVLAGCERAAKTTISLDSGEYMGEQEVVLSSDGDGDIYYTLDGSDPKENGIKYNSEMPLKLNYDATLKTYTKKGNNAGPIAEATYTIKTIEKQELKPEEREFFNNITGTYKNGDTEIIIKTDKTVEWKNSQNSGSSPYMVTVPDSTNTYKGTLTYTDSDKKEAKFDIDCLPLGDNAIFINGTSYDYQE